MTMLDMLNVFKRLRESFDNPQLPPRCSICNDVIYAGEPVLAQDGPHQKCLTAEEVTN